MCDGCICLILLSLSKIPCNQYIHANADPDRCRIQDVYKRQEVPGSEFELEVDAVIMSLGTSPNPLIRSTTPGLDTNKKGCLIADEETMATTREGVYAGGDAVTGAATVILAMGAGKKAAEAMDKYLKEKHGK